MSEKTKKPSNPRMHNPDGMYAGAARNEDFFSLRDEIAIKAMVTILSKGITISDENMVKQAYDAVAFNSYLISDAMLKQREL